MSNLRGRFVATIFVIRFFPQKLFGKLIGKLDGKFVGKFGWKCWLEMLVGKMYWKCWLKMLVNGCEIIGEKIVASNLPLRLSTTIIYTQHHDLSPF